MRTGAPGSNSDIITVDGDRAFVLRISEHKAEAVKPLAEVKAQVSDIVKHNKAEQQAKLEADKLLAALKDGKGDEAMKAAGLSFGGAADAFSYRPGSAEPAGIYPAAAAAG